MSRRPGGIGGGGPLEAPWSPSLPHPYGGRRFCFDLEGKEGSFSQAEAGPHHLCRPLQGRCLEGRLRQHIRQMQEQRKMFQGMEPFREMRKATEDLEVVRICRLYLKNKWFY